MVGTGGGGTESFTGIISLEPVKHCETECAGRGMMMERRDCGYGKTTLPRAGEPCLPFCLGPHSSCRAGGLLEGLWNFLIRTFYLLFSASQFGTLLAYLGGQGRDCYKPKGVPGERLCSGATHRRQILVTLFPHSSESPTACFSGTPGTFYKDLLIAPAHLSPLIIHPGACPVPGGCSWGYWQAVCLCVCGNCQWLQRAEVGTMTPCGGLWRAVGRGP